MLLEYQLIIQKINKRKDSIKHYLLFFMQNILGFFNILVY